VERHGLRYHEKTAGQLFCDGSAREIVELLEAECTAAGVRIETGRAVRSVSRSAAFEVVDDRDSWQSESLVVATGGLSVPKIGATPFGYSVAAQFGLRLVERRPALVPLTFGRGDQAKFGMLAGVSTEVVARAGGRSFREKMLFTHRGLSGPAILQISSYWQESQNIQIDLAPGRELTAIFQDPKTPRTLTALRSELRTILPTRFADRWIEHHSPASWTNAALADFERQVHSWTIKPDGTEGFAKAEVTCGGIDTDELSAKTMECRQVPGLFFIGEVVDVTGHLGGFNFQWAWSSGAAAGRAL